ncbi:MAG: serine hydrolase [Armatimonadetes bacterium]|nr:serine hydrolase [Armatimonadota bacterium]
MLAATAALIGMMGMQEKSADLDKILRDAEAKARIEFKDDELGDKDILMTLHVLDRKAKSYHKGSLRGDQTMYPASVVKVFYLGFAAYLMDEGRLKLTDETQRAAHDMIVNSNNDATGYMIDLVCGTTPGPELDAKGLADFGERRQAVNRWFASKGYSGVNAVQRTYNEGPYGREMQWLGKDYANRNMLSPDACAKFMTDVAFGRLWSEERTEWMKSLLHRANPADDFEKADGQARAYVGKVIPSETKLYSKAGWTGTTRHDLCWLVMPDGKELVIAIMTTKGSNMKLVSFLGAEILKSLGYEPRDPMASVSMPDGTTI